MSTLLSILDLLVLLFLVFHVVSYVRGGMSEGTGALLLTLCVAAAVLVLAAVSLAAYSGLLRDSSVGKQLIYLLVPLISLAILFACRRRGPV